MEKMFCQSTGGFGNADHFLRTLAVNAFGSRIKFHDFRKSIIVLQREVKPESKMDPPCTNDQEPLVPFCV